MRLTSKYRIYANQETLENASNWIDICRNLYNWALEQRITAYKEYGFALTPYGQMAELPAYKKNHIETTQANVQCMREVIKRLDNAYNLFYKRLKTNTKAGFPRFKSVARYNSFTMQHNGWKLKDNNLFIRNVGIFKLRLSRPIQGDIKTVTIRRSAANEWYVCFACDNVPEHKLEPCGKSVGIDVGITSMATDSEGHKIDNPRYSNKSMAQLRVRQRRLSHRIKGSNSRKQARLLVAKSHEKVANQRTDFLHKVANYYIKSYGTISVENLNIQGMVKNHRLARHILDGAWGQFFELLSYKAESAGRILIKVAPQNTSQNCSGCGKKVPKKLAQRIHACPNCGLILDRDENAARNINQVGQTCQALT
jgi:putative transposase